MNAFDQAASDYEAATIALNAAQQKRDDTLYAMLALMPAKDEGTVTERGLRYKVTATYGMNRTVDAAVISTLLGDEKLRWAAERLFPMKPGLSTTELRFFAGNEPGIYAQLAAAIVAKPGKPSIKVESMQEQVERRAA